MTPGGASIPTWVSTIFTYAYSVGGQYASLKIKATFGGSSPTGTYSWNGAGAVSLSSNTNSVALALNYGVNTLVYTSNEAAQGPVVYTWTITRGNPNPGTFVFTEATLVNGYTAPTGYASFPTVTLMDFATTNAVVVPWHSTGLSVALTTTGASTVTIAYLSATFTVANNVPTLLDALPVATTPFTISSADGQSYFRTR
jgi:hypothetical protein